MRERASTHFDQLRREPGGADRKRYARLLTFLTLVLAALPVIYLSSLVSRYGVATPHMDDWEMGDIIAKFHSNRLTSAVFFRQELEARTVVPKIIFIASSLRGHWEVREQMKLSLVVVVATAAGLFFLLQRANLSPLVRGICFSAIVLLLFSPSQYEVWLFASGLPSFLPVFFILAALLLYETRLSVPLKFGGSVFLATLSSFTLPHGLLAWGLTFPIYLFGNQPRRWKIWAAAWMLATALCAALYFHGYVKPEVAPPFAPAQSPWKYFHFFAAFLGNSLAYIPNGDRLQLSFAVGVVALLLLTVAIAYTWQRRADKEFVRLVLPWLALGGYSMGSAALATLGRIGFGPNYPIQSRYIAFSLYLLVAVTALLAIIAKDLRDRGVSPTRRRLFAVACFVLLGAGLGIFQATIPVALRLVRSSCARNRLGGSAILFHQVLDTSTLIKQLNYPNPPLACERAVQLDDLHMLRPRLIRPADLASRFDLTAPADGLLENIQRNENGRCLVSGWAALPGKKNWPADAVMLAYKDGDGRWTVFALSDTVVRRTDVARKRRSKDLLFCGWSANFSQSALPPAAKISGWAFDAELGKLYLLPGLTAGVPARSDGN